MSTCKRRLDSELSVNLNCPAAHIAGIDTKIISARAEILVRCSIHQIGVAAHVQNRVVSGLIYCIGHEAKLICWNIRPHYFPEICGNSEGCSIAYPRSGESLYQGHGVLRGHGRLRGLLDCLRHSLGLRLGHNYLSS